MLDSIESRLWLAVHLLYPNSSQAFDVYQAIVFQSEDILDHLKDNDSAVIFSKLVFVYNKINAIDSNLSFYEFESVQIDHWKNIYKNSQKIQLLIFIGILIFELKTSEIAPHVKLSQEKTQFIFHQTFKKIAQNNVKTKHSEVLNSKKQNDIKISYLFVYENLIEYCLGQLSAAESEKVKIGLELYPTLQIVQEEYLKIINQIQSLKVQRSNVTLTVTKKKLELVKPVSRENRFDHLAGVFSIFHKNKKKLAAISFVFLSASWLLFDSLGLYDQVGNSNKTVIIQQIEKKLQLADAPVASPPAIAPAAPESLPNPAGEKNTTQVIASATVNSTVALPQKETPTKAKASSGLYRGNLSVKNLDDTNKKLLTKIIELGAKKAGEVDLGWLKSNGVAYYHFTIPEDNIEAAISFFKQMGALNIVFEPHPRLIQAGSKRFILEVKGVSQKRTIPAN